jgi:hypothetical protein
VRRICVIEEEISMDVYLAGLPYCNPSLGCSLPTKQRSKPPIPAATQP